jgi:hypothetical protein
MSDQQVKEFFSSVLEGGPADHLDLDRAVAAGRRRRRIRTATTLASAAAVLVVVGAVVVSALPDDGRTDLGGATLSPTPSATAPSTSVGPDTVIEGSAEDWARALEPYLPAGTQTPAVRATGIMSASLPGNGNVKAVYRYTRDGRTTALVVSSFATVPEPLASSEAVASKLEGLEQTCAGPEVACDPRIESSSGPVIVRRWADGSRVAASSVRAGGIVVTVESWNADTDRDRILDGSGRPAFIDDIHSLVSLGSSLPVPAILVTSPTPLPTLATTAPAPTPSGSVSTGPEPTPTPTPASPTRQPTSSWSAKPVGLLGAYASEACERQQTFEYRVPQPIAGSVIEYVVCPYENGGTLVPYSVSPQSGAVFDDLDAALRRPGQPKADACRLKLDIQRPIFVRTNDGWFKVEQPTDGCGNRQPELLDAVTAIVGTAA